MKKFSMTNLSEKIKNIVFYPPINTFAFWENKTIKEKQYFVLHIWSGFKKRYKVETLSNDDISVRSIFSIWDLSMMFSIAIFAFMFPISIIFQFGIASILIHGISFVVLATYYVLFNIYCWRTIKNSIYELY